MRTLKSVFLLPLKKLSRRSCQISPLMPHDLGEKPIKWVSRHALLPFLPCFVSFSRSTELVRLIWSLLLSQLRPEFRHEYDMLLSDPKWKLGVSAFLQVAPKFPPFSSYTTRAQAKLGRRVHNPITAAPPKTVKFCSSPKAFEPLFYGLIQCYIFLYIWIYKIYVALQGKLGTQGCRTKCKSKNDLIRWTKMVPYLCPKVPLPNPTK